MAEIINGKEENTVQIEKEKLESVKKEDEAVKYTCLSPIQ